MLKIRDANLQSLIFFIEHMYQPLARPPHACPPYMGLNSSFKHMFANMEDFVRLTMQ
jgi:hypothetical protein